MAAQIPVHDWPSNNLKIVTVNAETGERRAFDRTSGVALVDVMVATTASIGSPPAIIHGQAHIDGGYYSSDNSDLAAGFEHVIVLALRPPKGGSLALVSLAEGVHSLRTAGSRVQVIQPDEEAMAAFASVGRKLIEEGLLASA
jgi:NTE family protein